ncbi:signal recognition particle receptor subunit alpha [Vulcanisaeta souniana]|uniref:signal recognition particle receptor subunit alpha n=1 Tax=Vulcanisaeta souniana TaxID=164452 RepID=UPI000AAC84E7|nr:signal recognition particle receptor subunit alpha [Vulcanisaeta souniana]
MFDKLRNAFKSFTNTIVNSITTTELSEDKLSEIRDNLFMQLVESDVAVDVAEAICDAIINYLRGGLKVPRFGDKELMIRNGILEVMNKLFSEIQDVDLISEVTRELQVKKPVILLFLGGPNGYGKTTTIAR